MGAFLAALPAFIASLPAMFQLAVKMMGLIERLVAWADKANVERWIADVESAIDTLEGAKTSDEKILAARQLGSVFRKLG